MLFEYQEAQGWQSERERMSPAVAGHGFTLGTP